MSRVTFVDIAEKSIEECKNRYENPMRANFAAEFIHLDATSELISEKISSKENLQHDMVSSQFVIHYSFETFEKADNFVKNVSDSLKTGGYFIGTTTNANEIVKRLRASSENSFGNELFNIKFYKENKEDFPLFGDKFDFNLDKAVECPEYLINFKALEHIAKRHNLKLVFSQPFNKFFEAHSTNNEYKKLISIMSALEPYYSKYLDKSLSEPADSSEYDYIKSCLAEEAFKADLKDDEQFVTMSKSEWDVATLYLVFAFVKVDHFEEDADSISTADELDNQIVQPDPDELDNQVESNLKRKLSLTSDESLEDNVKHHK